MRTPRYRHIWAAAVLAASLATPTLAGLGEQAGEPLEWSPVPSSRASLRTVAPRASGVILDFGVLVQPVPRRPVVQLPAVGVRVERVDGAGGHSLRGAASWYCGHGSRCTAGHPGGLYAAIRRDLLGHRGDRARVCSSGRCVTVTIVDCNCGPHANLIDLYAQAFERLAPLSRGRIPVTLAWL